MPRLSVEFRSLHLIRLAWLQVYLYFFSITVNLTYSAIIRNLGMETGHAPSLRRRSINNNRLYSNLLDLPEYMTKNSLILFRL